MRRQFSRRCFGVFSLFLVIPLQLYISDPAIAQTTPPAAPTSSPKSTAPLPPGWAEVDQRMVFLTVQLSTIESTIAATNKSLKIHGYEQTQRQNAANNAQKANELMDRNGGGPVPWQDFYGQTAEKFFYHPTDDNTVHVNPDAVAQRPPQFDYIYRANEQRAQSAQDDVQKIGDKIDDLLAYRKQLEEEQSALWAKISFRGDSSLDIAERPLYRLDLTATDTTDAGQQSVQAAKAAIAFMSAVNSELTDVQKNIADGQAQVFSHLLATTSKARADLDAKLIALPALAGTLGDPLAALGKFNRAAKRLEDSAQNIDDAFRLATACDTKGDESGKQIYRGQLQRMISDYSATFVTADQALKDAVTTWKLKQSGALITALSSVPVAGTVDVMGQLDAAKIARTKAVTAANRLVVKALDVQLDAAADAGNLALVQSLSAAKMAVAHDGTLPEDVKDTAVLDAANQSKQQIVAANDALAASYRAAVSGLTRARKFTDAQSVQDELDAFLRANISTAPAAGPAEVTHPALAGPAPAPAKTYRMTSIPPPGWQYDNNYEVRPNGLCFPDGHFIRTTMANYLERDFTLEVWITIDPKNPTCFFGLGSAQNGGHATPVNSICMVAHPGGNLTMYTREGYGEPGVGKEPDPGEYVLRLEKSGLTVTYSIGTEDKDGNFDSDVTQTYSDITKTPADFTEKNMHIFFGGGMFRQMRFTAVTPQTHAAAAATEAPKAPQATKLTKVLPPYLECTSSYSAVKDGLYLPGGHFIRTRANDFLNRDFVMDVWIVVDDKMQGALIGVGSGNDDQGGTPSRAEFLEVGPHDAHLVVGGSSNAKISDPGVYIVRVEKTGLTVTFSLGDEKDGVFNADFSDTIPDITKQGDFTKNNMHVFFGMGTYEQIRFSTSPAK